MTPYPAELMPSVNPRDYIRPYITAGFALLSHSHFSIYVLAGYAFVASRTELKAGVVSVALVIIPTLFVILHLLLFPAYMHRFFVFAAALMFVWILSCLNSERPVAA